MTDDQIRKADENCAKKRSSPYGIKSGMTPEEKVKFDEYHHLALWERSKRKETKDRIDALRFNLWAHYNC